VQYKVSANVVVYKERLIGVAVDEAHCIKTW